MWELVNNFSQYVQKMSDNSSMMIVVLVGGVMCCGVSCAGGLGFWYWKDPTMGGLFGSTAAASSDAAPSSDAAATSDSASSASAASAGGGGTTNAAGIPTPDTPTIIYSSQCKHGGDSTISTMITGIMNSEDTALNKYPNVGLACDVAETNLKHTWLLKSAGGGKFYYIVNRAWGQGYYLGIDGTQQRLRERNGMAEKDVKYVQWSIEDNGKKWQTKTFALKNRGTGQYLASKLENCNTWEKSLAFTSDKKNSKWSFVALPSTYSPNAVNDETSYRSKVGGKKNDGCGTYQG